MGRSMTSRQTLREHYAATLRERRWLRAGLLALRLGVTRAEFHAHRQGVHEWDDDAPPADFESFGTLAPGAFDPRVLDQTTWWVDILRRPHRITDRADFSDKHLIAVIDMLRRGAWRWAPIPEPAAPSVELAPVAIAAAVTAAYRESMEHSPLMQALRAEARRRGIEGSR